MADPRQTRASLDELGARIDAARDARRPKPRADVAAMRGWEVAFRMVLELVVGISIGSAMGYGLDALLGTLPLFLIVLGLLGFAAGIKVMMRTADEINRRMAAESGAGERTKAGPAGPERE